MLKKVGFAVAALLWATLAGAQAQGDEIDKRWYISPSIGTNFADNDSGPYGSLSVGSSITPYFGFEIEGTFGKLNVSDVPSDLDYSRGTFGVNLLQYFNYQDKTVRPYLIGGVNYHFVSFLDEKLNGPGVGLGAGIMFKLSNNWNLRTQARYNLDFINGKGSVPSDTFYIWDLGVGFLYKFGAFPADDDGDGIPNGLDKCPDTPRGVKVGPDGCPLDSDGDGIPDYLDKCPDTKRGTAVGPDGCPLDSDGDGIPDNLDKCPGSPAGVPVDANGCPLDSDGDGIPDYLDKCPGTPAGVKVGPDGCPVDSDGDGIPDYLDRCAKTPPGTPVGADGCPLTQAPRGPLDSDGDGIPDDQDQCPNTPPGLKVLPDGCALAGDCRKPRPGEAVDARGCALDRRFVLRGVKFEFDSDRLLPESKVILKEVAITLNAYPNIKVDVEGHTDWIGTDAYNLSLSERRSIAVQKFLGENGVSVGRLRPVGYGESTPIDTNDTEEGRENNRRVEFKVTSG